MLKKISNTIQYPGKKSKIAVAIVLATVMIMSFMTCAFAADPGTQEMSTIVTAILGVIFNVFFYIGILLLAWSVGMLVLAFKNEDADSKSRAMMLLVVSVALIGIKPLINAVLSSTGFSIS